MLTPTGKWNFTEWKAFNPHLVDKRPNDLEQLYQEYLKMPLMFGFDDDDDDDDLGEWEDGLPDWPNNPEGS